MRLRTNVFPLLLAAGLAAADDPPRTGTTEKKSGMSWMQPSPAPPVAATRPLRGQLAGDVQAHGAPAGELTGLRAVSLREGQAVITLSGESRVIQAGDQIGSATVKAVGSDRIILERPAPTPAPSTPNSRSAPTAGTAAIVVTFGPGGVARVRIYAQPGSEAPPPEIR